MSGDKLLDAMEFVSDDLILNAEKSSTSSLKPGLRKRHLAVLIAAAAVLICGTAMAAAGLFWNKPDVQTVGNGLRLTLNQGTVVMPNESVGIVLDSVDPERDFKAFLNFDSVQEWQEFFGLPFAASRLITPERSGAWMENERGELVQRGPIDAIVSTVEENGRRSPCLMWSVLSLVRYRDSGEETERIWNGDFNIFAKYREDTTDFGSYTALLSDPASLSAEECTAPSGIPYVIGEAVSDDTIGIHLYYGYESVLYDLTVNAHSREEADAIREDLKKIAQSLEILYPKNQTN
ncbi:MAG: hypothetical protein E7576_16565 [Ruminococcaceae bacterium]|nr:hypothetical protein [Oscillospiraceae bacterium]